MPTPLPGLHHVTAVAGDAQANLDFYTQVLGLRFVKRTVNFDDPTTYHLYYGDRVGTPGTALTFFPFAGAGPGRVGPGQAGATAFVVPPGSVDFWWDRLADRGVEVTPPTTRFDETVLGFRDPDGLPLELVVGESDSEPWADGPVPGSHGLRGFHGVTLHSAAPAATGDVLETLGFDETARDGDRTRYRAVGDRAAVLDLHEPSTSTSARSGAGTVHHIAFRTADEASQAAWREHLLAEGYRVTPVRDRQYFQSIYFREPGGVLFEIATEGPGFTADEAVAELGSGLKLPPWLEDDRESIAAALPGLSVPAPAEVED